MEDYSRKKFRWSSNSNAFLLLMFMALVFIGAPVITVILKLLGVDEVYNNLILFSFQYLVCVLGPVLIYALTPWGKGKPSLTSLFAKPQKPVGWIVKYSFIALFFVYGSALVSNVLFMLLQWLLGIDFHAIDMSADDNFVSKLTNIFAMVILAPIFEELLMRGVFVGNSSRYSTWGAIISCAIMFGLWHMNYEQEVYATMLGVCSGFIFLKTRSLIPSIALHMVMNALGATQTLFMGNIDLEQLKSGNTSYIIENISALAPILVCTAIQYLFMGIGLVLFIIEVIKNRQEFRLENSNKGESELKKLGVYFTAPATIVIVLIMLAVTVANAVLTAQQ